MSGLYRGLMLGLVLSTWIFCVLNLPMLIKKQGLETRRLIVELAGAKSRWSLNSYEIRWDDTFCVTNVVDDGKVVYP